MREVRVLNQAEQAHRDSVILLRDFVIFWAAIFLLVRALLPWVQNTAIPAVKNFTLHVKANFQQAKGRFDT